MQLKKLKETVEKIIGNDSKNKYLYHNIDHTLDVLDAAENLISRKIRYLILTENQMTDYFKNKPALIIWEQDK